MKKNILVIGSALLSLACFAQKATQKIILTPNQTLKITTTAKGNISQEAMGNTVDMLMDMASTKKLDVTAVNNNAYQIDYTTTHTKMEMSAMGKTQKFDSDNKDDMSGDKKEMGKDVNVTKKFLMQSTGECVALDTTQKNTVGDGGDPMSGMMQQMMGGGANEAGVNSNFMLLSTDKKQGDTWSDSTITNTVKIYNTYTWDSTNANIAVIKLKNKSIVNAQAQMMGMDVTTNTTHDLIETRKVDLNTGIIRSKNGVIKISGTVDAMGMTIPVNGTMNTTTNVD